MEVAAADFTWEQIEHDCLTEPQFHVLFAPAVREAAVSSLSEDHVGVFQIVIQQRSPHEPLDRANRQRRAVIIHHPIPVGVMRGDEIPRRLQHLIGTRRYRANPRDLIGVFGDESLVKKRESIQAHFADELVLRELRLNLAQNCQHVAELDHAIQPDHALFHA